MKLIDELINELIEKQEYLLEQIDDVRKWESRLDYIRRYLFLRGFKTKRMKRSQVMAIYYKERGR